MNCLKKTICTFLALWTPIVFAYTNLVNSDGETSSPAVAPIMGILLNEDGEPRCKITSDHSNFPASELDALEECTELSFKAEEIQMAGVSSPGKAAVPTLLTVKTWTKAYGPVLAILSFATLCADFEEDPSSSIYSFGSSSALAFHMWKLVDLKTKFGIAILSGLGTTFFGMGVAALACGNE